MTKDYSCHRDEGSEMDLQEQRNEDHTVWLFKRGFPPLVEASIERVFHGVSTRTVRLADIFFLVAFQLCI